MDLNEPTVRKEVRRLQQAVLRGGNETADGPAASPDPDGAGPGNRQQALVQLLELQANLGTALAAGRCSQLNGLQSDLDSAASVVAEQYRAVSGATTQLQARTFFDI